MLFVYEYERVVVNWVDVGVWKREVEDSRRSFLSLQGIGSALTDC